ncbi:SDR family oxidoreductase [Bacillus sp. JJ1609]|uniref:SDR family oxidoreductase n=1 Tax=Bacillus sp. JJ1609 TaxID=3122977 RepID=UPI002FFF3517
MKNAIVTGSSSGFGKLIAIELAQSGFNVLATMRDQSKADSLLQLAADENVKKRIQVFTLDVTSTASVAEFGEYLEGFNSVDVLVNNAGFAQGGFCEELTLEAYRQQFETNFFGAVALTQAVLPAMRAQGSGKIINMSSISGKFGFPGLSAYVSSKHALEGFSESLRLELKPFGIDVFLVEPGSYKTNIWSSIENVQLQDQSPYESSMVAILNEVKSGEAEYGDPREVAKLVAKIAGDKSGVEFRFPIGKGVAKTIFMKNLLPWKTIEKIVLKKLYRKHR